MIAQEIRDLEKEIARVKDDIDRWYPDESDYEEQYDDLLDELHEPMFGISPSRILSECDPIQYSCGLSDYVDSLELTPEDLESELEDREADLCSGLQCEIDSLKTMIEEEESEIEDIESEIEDIESWIGDTKDEEYNNASEELQKLNKIRDDSIRHIREYENEIAEYEELADEYGILVEV
jgi:chromosome segregation ATPase